MAVTKVSGFRRTTQLAPEGSSSETPPPPSRHVRVFETIANLDRRFDLVLTDLEQLKQFGLFRGEFPSQFAKTCRLTIEEMRAWAIFEVTEHIQQRAEEDWARFGRMLREWENKFKDPNDVLIEAERLKQKLQKAAGRKATKKKSPRRKVRERAE